MLRVRAAGHAPLDSSEHHAAPVPPGWPSDSDAGGFTTTRDSTAGGLDLASFRHGLELGADEQDHQERNADDASSHRVQVIHSRTQQFCLGLRNLPNRYYTLI
jgi:hypothetical protein